MKNKDHTTILFLDAPLKETIWGSSYFKDELKITDNNSIGEMWSCSGFKNCSSKIKYGGFAGILLKDLYKTHKYLFGNLSYDEFPILIKIIATSDKLSVQVHPDDEYAKQFNQYGKTECRLILNKNENSKLTLGCNAKNKDELIKMVNESQYEQLLEESDIEIGDFIKVNPGVIHAIGKDIVLLEIQQSSDITYRFYDYNRLDKNGQTRPLHVNQAIDVANCSRYNEKICNINKENIEVLRSNSYFDIYNYDVKEEKTLVTNNKCMIVTSLAEKLIINDQTEVKFGDSFIITTEAKQINIKGNGKLIVTFAK